LKTADACIFRSPHPLRRNAAGGPVVLVIVDVHYGGNRSITAAVKQRNLGT